MEKTQDLRIIKTHLALNKAFLEMLKEKRFEEITVNELCERAMVRRATFYKHFADKYEFFTFFVSEIQKQFEAETLALQMDKNPRVYCLSMTKKLVEFLVVNSDVVNCLIESKMAPVLLDLLSEQIAATLSSRLKRSAESGHQPSVSPEILATFYTGGLLRVLHRWLTQKKRTVSEKELLAEIEKLASSFDFG